MPPKNRKNSPKLPPKSKIATENPQNYPKIATEIQNCGAGRVEAVPRDGMVGERSDAEGKRWRRAVAMGSGGGRAEAIPMGRDAQGAVVGERSEQCLGEARLWLAPHC